MLGANTETYIAKCAVVEEPWNELWTYAIVFGIIIFLIILGLTIWIVIGNKKGTYCCC
jgi:heme/copper-type cytochrome/quinol oxidase subunit 4